MRWYTIQARAAGAAPEVQIHGEIGLGGITVADFSRDLKGLGEPKAITVAINSLGGAVFDGIAIHNILARHPAKVTVRVDGIAASVASLVAMAGDRVVMPENAMMMIHDPWAGVVGDAEDMRAMADVMDKVKQAMVAGYARKSGKAEAEVARLMAEETWLTAAEAVAMGFADEVMQPVRIAALGDLARYPKAPAALRGAQQTAKPETYAAEVRDLCALAGVPHKAAELVASGRALAEVRRLLIDAKVPESEAEPIVGAHASGYGARSAADPHGWDQAFAKAMAEYHPHSRVVNAARGQRP